MMAAIPIFAESQDRNRQSKREATSRAQAVLNAEPADLRRSDVRSSAVVTRQRA